MQELQIHTRLSAGLSKSSFNQDFSQHLRSAIIRPMIGSDGGDGVQISVNLMNEYSLLREDLDNLMEITTWEGSADPMKSVDSKVKAAFTRAYNKEVILPYATNIGAIAKKAQVSVQDIGLDDIDKLETNSDDNKDENDIELDSMIKAKKVKRGKDHGKHESQEKKGKGSVGRGRGKGKMSK